MLDSQGYATQAAWKIIEAKAAFIPPRGNYPATIRRRPALKKLYASYADWKAPEAPALPEGRLHNLADKPTQPRFPLTDKIWPEQAGDASVCLWADDKLAAMSLGIDDNCAGDVSYWKQLSQKYGGLNITWNLITAGIPGGNTNPDNKELVLGVYGTWELWSNLVHEGYHVASHTVTHGGDPTPTDGWPGTDWECYVSKHAIDSNILGYRTRILAYEGGGGITELPTPYAPWRASAIKYFIGARTGGGQPINQANMIDYFNILSTTAVQNALDNPKTPQCDLKNILFASDPKSPYHQFYRGWANIFIHFINAGKDFDTSPYYIQYGKCLAFYNDHRDDLWTGFIDDVALYGQERDTASVTTDTSSDAKIAFTLTDKMDPAVFDYPLTVKIRLPESWKGVAATQGAKPIDLQVIAHEGANFALVKAVPDQAQVTLVSAPAAAK